MRGVPNVFVITVDENMLPWPIIRLTTVAGELIDPGLLTSIDL
jgi:hypothetical protein